MIEAYNWMTTDACPRWVRIMVGICIGMLLEIVAKYAYRIFIALRVKRLLAKKPGNHNLNKHVGGQNENK